MERMMILAVLATTLYLLGTAAAGTSRAREDWRLIEEMPEDSASAELLDQADSEIAESEDKDEADEMVEIGAKPYELEDVQEEGILSSLTLIVINQCGSYAENFAKQIKPLSSYMSEITIRCGLCSSIWLKGQVNANIEFCMQSNGSPCLNAASLVLPQCKPGHGKLFRRMQSIPFQFIVGGKEVNGYLDFNVPKFAYIPNLCSSVMLRPNGGKSFAICRK